MLFRSNDTATTEIFTRYNTLSLHDALPINGVPIIGHQEPGGIADQTVRRLMRLQGTMQPHQIISLLDYGANTFAMADHANHIHVGFKPLFGTDMITITLKGADDGNMVDFEGTALQLPGVSFKATLTRISD